NCIGGSQALGPNGGTIGVTAMAFGFGQIPITTIDNPDGGLGTYSPIFMNLGVSYGRMMVEDRIYVGATVKMIHESIPDVSANGVAFDAGVQYRTGDGKFRLGVALRNIGPTMKYSGDGLSTRLPIYNNGASSDRAMSSKVATFEMPSALYVGAAYEIRAGAQTQRYKIRKQVLRGDTTYPKLDSLTIWTHKIIPMFTFISNTFTRDQLGFGLEYRYMEMLMLRAAYLYEAKIFNADERRNIYSGIAVGASFEFPFSMKNPKIGERNKLMTTLAVDYSYRHTFFFNGTHSFGLRFSL
ncbi:MAG: PorV/PorQ family protein, partial [Bacteroidia bacterium]|nr:PorV/PorQ family protein [Bacteroidia bacterium]MDW8334926.1 PorV/PorQ family protein [Bacteroidia bacterium]